MITKRVMAQPEPGELDQRVRESLVVCFRGCRREARMSGGFGVGSEVSEQPFRPEDTAANSVPMPLTSSARL
jgi:hypothetical protein